MNEEESNRLPYGIWTEPDGAEVIFNRYYCPIFRRAPDGTVTPIKGCPWIEWVTQDFLYDTRYPPSSNRETLRRCEALLAEWGLGEQERDNKEQAAVLAAFATRSQHDGSTLVDVLAGAAGDENYRLHPRSYYRKIGEATLKGLAARGILRRDQQGWWIMAADNVVPMPGTGGK